MLFHTFSWLPWINYLVLVSLSSHTRREGLFLTSVPFVQRIFPGTAIFLSDTPSRTEASTLHILQTAYHQAVITAHKASLRLTTFIPNFLYMVLNETKRILLANKGFYGLKRQFRSQFLSIKNKVKLYKTLIRPVLAHSSETWLFIKIWWNHFSSFWKKNSDSHLWTYKRKRGMENKIQWVI